MLVGVRPTAVPDHNFHTIVGYNHSHKQNSDPTHSVGAVFSALSQFAPAVGLSAVLNGAQNSILLAVAHRTVTSNKSGQELVPIAELVGSPSWAYYAQKSCS